MIKPLRWTLKFFKFVLLFIVSVLFLAFWLSMVISPVYDFPEPEEFSGNSWYNPYSGLDTGHWRKSNFQAQSKAWAGMTNGQNNPAERVWHDYEALGYDVITISDYMKINEHKEEGLPYLRVYEHGYGAFKTHQVLIGADKVFAWDYLLYQTRNNKQFILNQLKDDCDVVAIAHPSIRNAYSLDDMTNLTGYDLIECLNNFRNSLSHWDAALSGGKPMFLLANDDAHDLDNYYDRGRMCTMIHCPSMGIDSLKERLRRGLAYGYVPFIYSVDTWEIKVSKWNSIPTLKSAEIVNNRWQIAASEPISRVKFIGQGGDTLWSESFEGLGANQVSYGLMERDTYVRAEIELKNRDVFYLNPVIRTEGGIPKVDQATINWFKTIVLRGILFILTVLGIRTWVRRRKKKNCRCMVEQTSLAGFCMLSSCNALISNAPDDVSKGKRN